MAQYLCWTSEQEQARIRSGIRAMVPGSRPREKRMIVRSVRTVVDAQKGQPPVAEKTTECLPFAPTEDSLPERLEAFLAWLIGLESCHGAFVIDEDGLPLLDRNVNADLIAVSSSFSKLLDRFNETLQLPLGNAISIEVPPADFLQLASADTSAGKYLVGLLLGTPVHRESLLAIQAGLKTTFELEYIDTD